MAEAETVRHCRCDDRYEAMRDGRFLLDPRTACWYFPNDPPRRVVNSWRSEYYGTENHDGEPLLRSTCPWCGGDLPSVELQPPYESSPDATAGEGDE